MTLLSQLGGASTPHYAVRPSPPGWMAAVPSLLAQDLRDVMRVEEGGTG